MAITVHDDANAILRVFFGAANTTAMETIDTADAITAYGLTVGRRSLNLPLIISHTASKREIRNLSGIVIAENSGRPQKASSVSRNASSKSGEKIMPSITFESGDINETTSNDSSINGNVNVKQATDVITGSTNMPYSEESIGCFFPKGRIRVEYSTPIVAANDSLRLREATENGFANKSNVSVKNREVSVSDSTVKISAAITNITMMTARVTDGENPTRTPYISAISAAIIPRITL